MPKKTTFETEAVAIEAEPVVVPEADVPKTLFNVIIDGKDMAVYAKDHADLQVKIAKIRSSFTH